MAATATDRISGIEKAAVLMVSLGTATSAEVFKHLSQDEIKRLSAGIIALKKVDDSTRAAVLEEFAQARSLIAARPDGPRNFAADLVESAIMVERKTEVAEPVRPAVSPAPSRPIARVTLSFDDITKLDGPTMKSVLAAVEPKDLCLALKAASDDVRNAIFGGLSGPYAGELKSELAGMGAVKLRDIEQAQDKIAAIAQQVLMGQNEAVS